MKGIVNQADRCARRGSTLVVVALLMAAVAMLSLSFLTVLQSAQKENQGSRESLASADGDDGTVYESLCWRLVSQP